MDKHRKGGAEGAPRSSSTAPVAARKGSADSRFLTKAVERRRLPNGLTVLLRPDPAAPSVSTMIWYKVGSRHEEPGIRGVSHLIEHLMFKGTDRFGKGEIDFITTRNGGSNNAFTSVDSTAYYFSFASDRWLQALEIEASRMRGNAFDGEEFELEKQVVIEELHMDLDSPWGALRQLVETHSFRSHPYRFPVIGLLEDLENLTLERTVEYYRRHYAPNNAILVIAGDFDREEAMDRVNRLFGSIQPQPLPPQQPSAADGLGGPTRLKSEKESRLSRMLISFPCPSVGQEDFLAVQLLDRILSEGKLSRLYQRLVVQEKAVASAASECSETFDPYLFLVRAELRDGVSPKAAEELLFDEFEQLRSQPLKEGELERAKNQCCTQALQDFETSVDQAVQLGLLETLGGYEYWDDYLDRICAVTASDVRAAARRYLDPSLATIGFSVGSDGV